MKRLLLLSLALLPAACAPSRSVTPIELSGANGGVLMVVTVTNDYKPAFQPTDLEIALVPDGARRTGGFGEDPLAAYRTKLVRVNPDVERPRTFVLLMPLHAGTYALQDVRGGAAKFPMTGAFNLPIIRKVSIQPGRLTYLGHVDAVNRERRSDQERRAGPVIPLVDQAAAGFSGGTFDLTIRDSLSEDLGIISKSLGSISPERIDTALVGRTF
jgi:hypothetical protein